MIEQRHEAYHVRDLRSTLGTIVNGQPIGDHFCTDDVLLRARENEVIAGGAGSPFRVHTWTAGVCLALDRQSVLVFRGSAGHAVDSLVEGTGFGTVGPSPKDLP